MSALVWCFEFFRIYFCNWEKRPPILILTSGKVASTAVAKALKNKYLKYSVYHMHYMTESGVANQLAHHKSLKYSYVPRNIIVSILLRKKMLRNRNIRMRVISLVREPIGQIISNTFQDVRRQQPQLIVDGKLDNDKVIDHLNYLVSIKRFNGFFNWIDDELSSFVGIKVFDEEFDSDRGFQMYNGEHADLLIIRLEQLSDVISVAIESFLKTSVRITLPRANSSANKEHATTYEYVHREYRMPKPTILTILNEDKVRHFYNDQIDRIVNKWSVRDD
jgi:hypothetical protein